MKRKGDPKYENQLNHPRKTRLRRKTSINYDDAKENTKNQIQQRSFEDLKKNKKDCQSQEEIEELIGYFSYFISDLNKLMYEEENLEQNHDEDTPEGSLNKRSDEYFNENYEIDNSSRRRKKTKQYERRKTRKTYLKEKKNRKKSEELEIINEEENKEVNEQVSHQGLVDQTSVTNKILNNPDDNVQIKQKSFLDIQINEKDENIDNNQAEYKPHPPNLGKTYIIHKNKFHMLTSHKFF